jgi:hypothetical protein
MKISSLFLPLSLLLWPSCIIVEGYISPGTPPHHKWEPPSQSASNKQGQPKQCHQEPPANLDVEDIFREEYRDWAKRYGKKFDIDHSIDDPKYNNFKLVSGNRRCLEFVYWE